MKLLRRLFLLALLAILAVVLIQNQRNLGLSIEFAFLKWRFSLVLGFWILLGFIAGAALFALLDAWRGILLRFEIRKREQEIARLEKELSNLRRSPDSGK